MEVKSVVYLYIFIQCVYRRVFLLFFESMFGLNFVGNSSIRYFKHKKRNQYNRLSHFYYGLFS